MWYNVDDFPVGDQRCFFCLAPCDESHTAWSDWRMLFEGKEYPPKYKSLKHQQRVYKKELK